MTTFTWTLTSLQVTTSPLGLTGVLQAAGWKLTADRAGTSTAAEGIETLHPPAADTFVPLDDLTPDIVLGWVRDVLGDGLLNITTFLESQLDDLQHPPQTILLGPEASPL